MDRTSDTMATATAAAHRQAGIVRCDEEFVIADASLSLCRFVARRRHELVGRSLLSFVDGDGLAVLTGDACRRLTGERLDATTVEVNFVDRRGHARPARLTLVWVPDPVGSFFATVVPLGSTVPGDGGDDAPGLSLTERAPDLIWRLRLWPEPGFEYVSPSSRELLGYPPSAFYGDPHLLAHLAADADEEAKLLALYDGQWNPHEPLVVRLVHRDGGVRVLEQRTTGILDGERRVLAIEAISRDVTGRHGIESELLAEVAVRRVLDGVDGFADDALGPEAIVARAVDATCRESGWALGHALLIDEHDPEALISTHVWPGESGGDGPYSGFRRTTHRRRWPIEGDGAEVAVITGEVQETDLDASTGGERARAALACGLRHVVVVPVPLGEGTGAAVEFYADETYTRDPASLAMLERVAHHVGRLIERGREVQVLRQMDEARTEFVTRAAHELRGPVGSIAVMASALALEARRSGAVDITGSLERLAGQAERIQLMATRLLELSQLEQGRLDVTLDAVVLRDAVEHAAATVVSPDSSVTIGVGRDLKVLADPAILDELLTNLLANAERHGGPNIDITAKTVSRSTRTDVEVTVSDDGPGVPDALLPHLFEPLRHRLTSPTQSGLGLALVRQMAITLGGEVSYEPAAPHGARFTVILSLA